MPSYDKGYRVGAKLGTLFYGFSTGPTDWQELAVDLSQEEEDLVEGDSCIYALNDARFARSSPRTVHLELTIANTSSGTLWRQGQALVEQLLTVAAGEIVATVNGVVVGSLLPEGLTGTARVHQLAWITAPNPDATGASDAELSWLVAWNESTATASRAGPFVHEAADLADDFVFFGAASDVGGDAYTGVISTVSFHERAMTLRELYNDYVAPAGDVSTATTVERERLPLTVESGLGDVDQCYGPTHGWAAANARGLWQRLATARHERYPALVLSRAYAQTSNPEWAWQLPQTAYYAHLGHLVALPVPVDCTHLSVRLHAKLWVTSGAAVPIGLRVYCGNRPAVLNDELGVPIYSASYVESVIERDDGVFGVGEWSDPQLLSVSRGPASDPLRRDWAYVFVAWAIDPAARSGNDANARVQINAIHLVPCSEA